MAQLARDSPLTIRATFVWPLAIMKENQCFMEISYHVTYRQSSVSRGKGRKKGGEFALVLNGLPRACKPYSVG